MSGLAEASAENIFRVKDVILSTSPASAGVLRGVTRAINMEIEFRRSDISREELYTSDELFLTGTAAGVTRVREVDGRKIGSGNWPLTERLRKAYMNIVHGRDEKYTKWLTILGEPISRQIEAHAPRAQS